MDFGKYLGAIIPLFLTAFIIIAVPVYSDVFGGPALLGLLFEVAVWICLAIVFPAILSVFSRSRWSVFAMGIKDGIVLSVLLYGIYVIFLFVS